jgi:hypothetical protein
LNTSASSTKRLSWYPSPIRSTTLARSYATFANRKSAKQVWGRFTNPKEETLWYYRALAKAFREQLPGQLANELKEIVDVLEKE